MAKELRQDKLLNELTADSAVQDKPEEDILVRLGVKSRCPLCLDSC